MATLGLGDSIDVSQIKGFALDLNHDLVQDHDQPPRSTTRTEGQTEPQAEVTEKPGTTRSPTHTTAWPAPTRHLRAPAAEDSQVQQPASQPDLPSTIPDSWRRRMLDSSQSQGDTQPISQSFYEQFHTRSKEQSTISTSNRDADSKGHASVPHTLQSGEPGHIDLLAAFEQPTVHDDENSPPGTAEEDDIDPLSQPQDVRADIFPESRRFQPPKTPASQGRKRKRDLRSSSEGYPTPRLPVNPFAGQAGNPSGLMSASQLFQATQAVTSPLMNHIPSDGLSERPSPDIHNLQRPSTAGPMSSPVRMQGSNMVRAVTEPQSVYISMKESQEARDRLLRARIAEQELSPDDLSDEDFDADSQLRKRLRQRRYNSEARIQFQEVASRSAPSVNGRNQQGKRYPERKTPRRFGTQASEPVLISDDAPAEYEHGSISEDETEREDDLSLHEEDDIDELGEENKENVEIPASISRARCRNSRIAASQPTPSHKPKHTLKNISPNKKVVQVLDSSQAPSSRGTPRVIENDTQPEAIADSQPSQLNLNDHSRNRRPQSRAFSEPRSSLETRTVVPPSQASDLSRRSRPNGSKDVEVASIESPSKSLSQFSRQKEAFVTKCYDHDARQQTFAAGRIAKKGHPQGSTEELSTVEDPLASASKDAQSMGSSASIRFIAKSTIDSSIQRRNSINGTDAPIPKSSANMPSPTTTPKSSSKISSGQTITSPSRNATEFETPPERLANSPSKPSPLGRVRRTQSAQSSPDKSRHLRRMSEIAADPSPPDLFGEVDVDVHILSNEDLEFQKTLRGSSPLPPSRKRRKGGNGSATNNGVHTLPDLPGTPLPPPSSAISKITPVKITSDKITPAPSSSPPHNTGSPVARTSTRDRDQEEAENRPHQDQGVSLDASLMNGVTKTNGMEQEVSNSRHGQREAVIAPIRTNLATSDQAVTNDAAITAPNRVFAYFNGRPAAYHPATCLGIVGGDEPRYSVRFDDGTVDTISAYGIKRLELRPGDIIKLDLPGSRTKSYVVEGMKDLHRPVIAPDPATPSRRGRQHSTNDSAFPETDIHGMATVIASPKPRDSIGGNEEPKSPIEIPLTQVYFTQTLWTSYRNRQYTHVPKAVHAATGLQTPSERPSTPSTPSSRTRRVRASGLAQYRTAHTITRAGEGLFHNMVFAITNVDHAEDNKRVKEQISQNGGTILDKGFDELFHVPTLTRTTDPDPSSFSSFELTSKAQDAGFTCLIADKHCRRAKFIQALALGIPCLATRWVSDCVTKQRILPWAPYLLPAGESAFLGGATRSSSIQPFTTDTISLPEIVGNRPKLLEGDSVLLIMEKGQQELMKQHPLLTHALGARKVSRAVNEDAAAKAVCNAQALNDPWDWVFSYDKEKEVRKRLFGGSGTGQKRKRGRESEVSDVPGKKVKTKVVGNEFVVQSLILGMLIDD